MILMVLQMMDFCKSVGSSSSKPPPSGPVLIKEVSVFCLLSKVESAYKRCNGPLRAGIVVPIAVLSYILDFF